ncbi:MAG: GNAT family N-acetyltransferase [Bacteroidales bacterium]|nr:GNAT family N-acetyltransferase [Bacteroidales bacterium]
MFEIRNLSGLSPDEMFIAFSEAFADYEITLDKVEHQRMLNRRGFDAALSFGAFEDGRLVSFTCNGIGTFNGQSTAYDTGTGTLKEYRGQGLASRVFEASIPFLVEAGIRQYLLEVLQHNEPAVSVYRKMGFEVSREFNYFVAATDALDLKDRPIPGDYILKSISMDELGDPSAMWDFTPSWQNSFEAIGRKPEDFSIIGIYCKNQLTGYGIVEPASGDITQLAVHTEHRRKGLGTAILGELVKLNMHPGLKSINTDTECQAIESFFISNGLPLKGKQFEMIRKL